MNRQNKGKRGEKEFNNVVNTLLGNISRRRKENGLPRLNLNSVAAVHDNEADIQSIPGLAIEVKRQETLSVGSWWNQACRQADNLGAIPVLAYRQNRGKWKILLPGYLLGIGIRGTLQCDLETFEDWLYIYLT
jgi:hypothetical protein